MYIVKNIKITSEMKMAEVVLSNPYFVLMLEHFEIDLAVQEKTVSEICKEYGFSLEVFLTFANLFNGVQYTPAEDFSFNDTQIMIKYLRNCHNYYLNEKCPSIHANIQKMYTGDNNSEIELVENFFKQYLSEITEHIDYENNIVFPYITGLYLLSLQGDDNKEPGKYSVMDYKEHHNDIEEKLTDINNLLIKYLPQKDDRKVRRKLLFKLFELEYDLNIHSKIEDSILIPLVQKLEQHLRRS